MKKIVICGGHHNSALVLAEELIKEGYQVLWFGHKYSMIGDKKPSAEYLEVTKKQIPFFEIKAGKFQPNYRFWPNLLRIPLGFFQSFLALLKTKPDLVVSFGGYLALPVAFCSYLLGIPVVTHEQTTVIGLSNLLISKIAKKIFITFPSSAKFFPQSKVILTGLPLRKNLFEMNKKLFSNSKKTIYITGGKQGAHVINKAVFEILPELLKKFNIIHQCGSTTLFDDIKTAEQIKCSLGNGGKNYLVSEYFFDSEIGTIFGSADFVISRAGAHTVYELMVLEKPAILIPIPWSHQNEQVENAKILVDLGLAEILPQEELEKGKLLEFILTFEKNLSKYTLKGKFKIEKHAEKIITQEIKKILDRERR